MSVRYSDFTVEQLRGELGKLKEKLQTAEQMGEINKVSIYERKIQIVSSYMLNPDEYKKGMMYQLQNDPGYRFKVNDINGIMAWGHRVNLLNELHETEEALPISLLGKVVKGKE